MNHEPSRNARYAIGVDTGGTHTDVVLAGDGRLVTLKVPSTPADLSIGIVDGVLATSATSSMRARS
jgi:N-methylhydantoinase A